MVNNIVERTYGIVAENKVLGENTILVWSTQKTPWMEGDVQSQLQSVTTKGVDASGKAIEVKSRTDTAIEAIWEPTDSSWATAPDVQRGEQVELIRYSNQNIYYWRERGNGANKRRLETKRLMVSASKTAGEPNIDTHYMIEISGHTGAINISTCKANGELAAYAFTLNGKGGMASLSDGDGREFVIDSVNDAISMRNASETLVEINQQDINFYALGTANLVAQENFIVEARNIVFKVGEIIQFTAGSQFDCTAPDISLNGAIHLNGPISQDSSASGGFDATFKGKITSDGDVVAEGVSVANHDHGGVETGGGTTEKPNKV